MKEFLDTAKNFMYVQDVAKRSEDWIEIPDGATELTIDNSKTLTFWKDEFNSLSVGMGNHWVSSKSDDVLNFSQYSEDWYKSLWQREKIEVGEEKEESAWDVQEGGSHYKDLVIQPAQYALANKLDYAQGNIVKYVTRHASKNGKEDLLKAKHYIDLMIEHYYGEK